MAQPGDVQRILRVCEQGDESALQLLLDAGWRVKYILNTMSEVFL